MSRPRTVSLAILGTALLVAVLWTSTAVVIAEAPAERGVLAGPSTNDTSNGSVGSDAVGNVTIENVTVWVGPRSVGANVTSQSAIESARDADTLRRDTRVAWTDTIVLEVHAPGIGERMAAVGGDNVTDRFLRATYGGDSHLTLPETTSGKESQPRAVQFDHTSTTAFAASANDTYYLLVEPESLPIGLCGTVCGSWKAEEPVEGPMRNEGIRYDTGLAINATIGGRTSTPRRTEAGNPATVLLITDVKTDFVDYDHDVEALALAGEEAVPVPVQTSLAPGTSVTVRIVNRSDGGQPLVTTTTVSAVERPAFQDRDALDPDHGVIGRLDTTGIAPGATFDVQLVANGDVVDEVAGLRRAESTQSPTADRPVKSTRRGTPTGNGEATSTAVADVSSAAGTTDGTGPGFGPASALVALVAIVLVATVRQ